MGRSGVGSRSGGGGRSFGGGSRSSGGGGVRTTRRRYVRHTSSLGGGEADAGFAAVFFCSVFAVGIVVLIVIFATGTSLGVGVCSCQLLVKQCCVLVRSSSSTGAVAVPDRADRYYLSPNEQMSLKGTISAIIERVFCSFSQTHSSSDTVLL